MRRFLDLELALVLLIRLFMTKFSNKVIGVAVTGDDALTGAAVTGDDVTGVAVTGAAVMGTSLCETCSKRRDGDS